jgi:hypothetical protein
MGGSASALLERVFRFSGSLVTALREAGTLQREAEMDPSSANDWRELHAICQLVAAGALARVTAGVAEATELTDALAFIVLAHEHEKLGVVRPVGWHIWAARVERLATLDCEAYRTADARLRDWLSDRRGG